MLILNYSKNLVRRFKLLFYSKVEEKKVLTYYQRALRLTESPAKRNARKVAWLLKQKYPKPFSFKTAKYVPRFLRPLSRFKRKVELKRLLMRNLLFLAQKSNLKLGDNIFSKRRIYVTQKTLKLFLKLIFHKLERKKRRLARSRRRFFQAVLFFRQTKNNFFITLCKNRKTVFWWSAGKCGFHGPKRATSFAAEVLVKRFLFKMRPLKLKFLKVVVQTPVSHIMESALKVLMKSQHYKVRKFLSRVPKAHGFMRKRKKRSL